MRVVGIPILNKFISNCLSVFMFQCSEKTPGICNLKNSTKKSVMLIVLFCDYLACWIGWEVRVAVEIVNLPGYCTALSVFGISIFKLKMLHFYGYRNWQPYLISPWLLIGVLAKCLGEKIARQPRFQTKVIHTVKFRVNIEYFEGRVYIYPVFGDLQNTVEFILLLSHAGQFWYKLSDCYT